MTLVAFDSAPTLHASLPDTRIKEADPRAPGFTEVMGAAARQSNTFGSAVSSLTADLDPWAVDDGFNTLDYVRERYGDAFEAEHGERFIGVFNRRYADALKAQIDMEIEDRKTLAAAGSGGVIAELFMSVADPTSLLPGGAAVKSVKAGKAIVGSALRVGAAGAVAGATAEAALQATQQTRTVEESLFAIGGSAILSGALGAVIGPLVSRAARRDLAARLQADLNAPPTERELADAAGEMGLWMAETRAAAERGDIIPDEPPGALDSEGVPSSAGAAATTPQTLDDLTVAGSAARRTAKETAWLNPGLRLFNSPSAVVRGIAERMGEWTLYLKKNVGPNGRETEQAVETLVERYMGGVAQANLRVRTELYPTYRKGGGTMSRDAFNREVGKAMRMNDEHPIPEVAAAAKEYRARVLEPVLQRAIEVGLLPKNVTVKTAASYFPRLWNTRRLVAEEASFKETAAAWMGEEFDRVIEIQRDKMLRLERNITSEIDDLEMAALRRAEELRRREAGDETDLEGFNAEEGVNLTEGDVLRMIRMVKARKLPKVETLKDYLHRIGGLYDPGGDVGRIEYRRPGFLKKTRRSDQQVAADKGGWSLDDAAQMAWDEGFFPHHTMRPTPDDLLNALAEDVAGNIVVREADAEVAATVRNYYAVDEALTRLGVDIERPRFATSAEAKEVLAAVNKALRDADLKRIEELRQKLADAKARHDFDVEAYTGAERATTVKEAVDAVFDKLTGRFGDMMPALRNVVPVKRGPLKERTFNIPDALVEQWLENDVDLVMQRHARIAGAEAELTGKFGRADMEDQIKELQADYKVLRERIEALPERASPDDPRKPMTRDEKERAFKMLDKREKADRRDLEALRDMLRGNYNAHLNSTPMARTLNAVNILNYMAALGGTVLSSITEPFRLMILHGVGRTMTDGIAPLMTNLKAIKLSRKDARLAGALIERELATNLTTFSELLDPYAANSPIERFLEKSARLFSKYGNGLVFWTDLIKTIDSNIIQKRIIDAARKGWENVEEGEKTFLRQLGLNETRMRHIAGEFDRHGMEEDGIPIANIERWDQSTPEGRSAYRAYSAAVTKNARTAVVMAGKMDKPLIASTPLGRALMQFQSYALGAHQRVFMRTMQAVELGGVDGSRAGATAGIAAMISMGMMVYYLKMLESGREVSDNPGTWIAEGLDRSGLLTLFFAANNYVEKLTNAGMYGAMASLFPNASQKNLASRYMTRTLAGTVGGPTVGFAENLYRAVMTLKKAADPEGNVTEGDINAMIRMMPLATAPGIRTLMEYQVKPALHRAVED